MLTVLLLALCVHCTVAAVLCVVGLNKNLFETKERYKENHYVLINKLWLIGDELCVVDCAVLTLLCVVDCCSGSAVCS